MYRFRPTTPRAALGTIAVAMAAITFGLAVLVPAKMESGSPEAGTVMASKAIPATPTEVFIVPASIDVVEVCEPAKAFEPVGYVRPTREERS